MPKHFSHQHLCWIIFIKFLNCFNVNNVIRDNISYCSMKQYFLILHPPIHFASLKLICLNKSYSILLIFLKPSIFKSQHCYFSYHLIFYVSFIMIFYLSWIYCYIVVMSICNFACNYIYLFGNFQMNSIVFIVCILRYISCV